MTAADLHQASIKLGIPHSTVTVGGTDLSNAVRALRIEADHDSLPLLILVLDVYECDVDGQVRIELPPETRAALVALGWTPPAGDDRA